MSKMRVYEYAKQRNLTSKEVLNHLKELKVDVSNHMSTITSDVASQHDEKLQHKQQIIKLIKQKSQKVNKRIKENQSRQNRIIIKVNVSNKIKNSKKEIINKIKSKINNQNKSRQRKKKHLKKLSIMAP